MYLVNTCSLSPVLLVYIWKYGEEEEKQEKTRTIDQWITLQIQAMFGKTDWNRVKTDKLAETEKVIAETNKVPD